MFRYKRLDPSPCEQCGCTNASKPGSDVREYNYFGDIGTLCRTHYQKRYREYIEG